MNLRVFLKSRAYLFWYISDLDKLSNEAILEGVIKNGDWQDIKDLKEILGKEELAKSYEKIKNKKRINISKIEINFMDLYIKNA